MVVVSPDAAAPLMGASPEPGATGRPASSGTPGGQAGTPSGLIRLDGSGTGLARNEARPWVLPGSDELFRSIYTRTATGGSEVLAVCSAIAGEGKTTVSLGLGVTMAQDFPERRVVLVETDLQRPVLAQDFGLEPAPGLVECLVESRPMQVACRDSFLDNLHLLPAGGPAPQGGRLLRSSAMAAGLDTLRRLYDIVILDIPAILSNSDSLLLTDLADGVILVVRAGVTPAPLVNRAMEELDSGKFRGVVLNEAHSSIPRWLRRLLGL